ncbi:hypothetical protein BGZ68_003050 [Mortierella alpina]|nr:hypothetical protein BGZ68_003050 [Mortierella alpina]
MSSDIRDVTEGRQHDEGDGRQNDESRVEDDDEAKQPARPKFHRRRKFWIFCIPISIIVIIVAVILTLYVIMPKIAQGLMNNSAVSFEQIDITNPSTSSMDIVMKGEMTDTGPFHAVIAFSGPITVSWKGKVLGTTLISGESEASDGKGDLHFQSKFSVIDAAAFTEFSTYMLNEETFVWHLEGKLRVKALGRTFEDLDLSKDTTVRAFNGLRGIKIEKFLLPGDDPSGRGIIIEIDTTVTNPSSIQMYMGSLTLAISYKDTLMGYVTSPNVTMVRGPQILSMKGILVPQTTPEGLASASEMMSRYISHAITDTIATGFEVKPDGVNSVEWLSAAVKNLKLTVPLQSPAPLQLIKALDFGALGLVFTSPTAYSPTTTSTGVLAHYTLPDGFGFKVEFTQVANSFTLSRNGVTIASVNATYNPSTSNMAAGTMTFNLLETPLLVPDGSRMSFQEFNRDLTVGSKLPFDVVGHASVYAKTSIGTVNLVNIPFKTTTELSGLQSLDNPAPTVTKLQVVDGTSTALTMAIDVAIVNPSSISLNAGDVVLDLIYKGARLGTVTMPQLALVPGINTIQATSTINPAASPEGHELLNLYTSGAGADVSIVGTPTSTQVESLSLAFGALKIGTKLPGLEDKLLARASLVILDTTLVNGLAQTVVTVNNIFIPPMIILSIDATITYKGVTLGKVVSKFSSPPVIPGKSQGTISASLAMNTNPHDLILMIRAQAIKNRMNTDAFDGLLALQKGGNPPSSVFEDFNVADFILEAMVGLAVDIKMTTSVRLGKYPVTMPYMQEEVPTTTDRTILKLLPMVGTPIAQLLVDRSQLAFDAITLLAPSETSFHANIVGAITATGPLDAQIEFLQPVTISYRGKAIGAMKMPTVNAIANKGAALDFKGVKFTITDLAAFTEFNVYALNNAKIKWTISATGLIVTAMVVAFPGVTMNKTVTLDGFRKLEGLQIESYAINRVDASGLQIIMNATLTSPSTIGMTIPHSVFQTQLHGKVLGPATADNLVLPPHGSSALSLMATIASGTGDLRPLLTGIFKNALAGIATPLDAQGMGAPGVSWLDAAIKSLLLHIVLPPLKQPPITAVSIDSMSMDFACSGCGYAPMVISTITATTNLPFTHSPPIVELSQKVEILDTHGEVVGRLTTPYVGVSVTGNRVTTTAPKTPLVIDAGSKEVYHHFISDLNADATYNLGLRGVANSKLDLGPFGIITLEGIPLDVKTSIDGLQGLRNIKFVSLLEMAPTDDLLIVSTLINIYNPSKLTLHLGDLVLQANAFNYTNESLLGVSKNKNLQLVPGANVVPARLEMNTSYPAVLEIVGLLYQQDVPIMLSASTQISQNPALHAGLAKVRTSVVVPKGLSAGDQTQKPYSPVWSLKVLQETARDGLIEMTQTIYDIYPGATMRIVKGADDRPEATPNSLEIYLTPDYATPLADFLPEMSVELKPNESKKISFKMRLRDEFVKEKQLYEEFFVKPNGKRVRIVWRPAMAFGTDPTAFMLDWSSESLNTTCTLQTGPDLPLLRKYYDNISNNKKIGNAIEVPGAIVPPERLVVAEPKTTTRAHPYRR